MNSGKWSLFCCTVIFFAVGSTILYIKSTASDSRVLLAFNTPVLDLGVMPKGAQEHPLYITNNRRAECKLTLESSCGCTLVTRSVTVASGSTVPIYLKTDTSKVDGPFSVSVTATSSWRDIATAKIEGWVADKNALKVNLSSLIFDAEGRTERLQIEGTKEMLSSVEFISSKNLNVTLEEEERLHKDVILRRIYKVSWNGDDSTELSPIVFTYKNTAGEATRRSISAKILRTEVPLGLTRKQFLGSVGTQGNSEFDIIFTKAANVDVRTISKNFTLVSHSLSDNRRKMHVIIKNLANTSSALISDEIELVNKETGAVVDKVIISYVGT